MNAPAAVQALAQPAADPFLSWPDGSVRGMFDIAPAPLEWFAEGVLQVGRAHALVGVGGSSKTRALYHLAEGAVTGAMPWPWAIKRTGSAILFLAEDTLADVHRTLHAIGTRLTPEQRAQLTRLLRVFPLAGKPARLLTLAGSVLHETEVCDWAMRQIERVAGVHPPAFIGFDPALALTEGDELNQAHQRRLGELMDRFAIETGACVVLTAHAAKGLVNAEELGSHAARGGGALTDAVRGEIVVRNMNADEARRFGILDRAERQRYVQLAVTKGNMLPPEAFAPLWLKRGAAGLLSAVSLEQVERGTVGDRESQALALLAAAHQSGETQFRFWLQQCDAAGLLPAEASTQAKEKAMQRIKDALVDAGLVLKGSARGLWVPA